MLRVTEIGQTIVTLILLLNSFLPNPHIWVLYVAVALHAVNRAGPLLGKRVLVTGCGPIGRWR